MRSFGYPRPPRLEPVEARLWVVTDEQIRAAQRELWQRFSLVAEPGGATAAAALFAGVYTPEPGERLGVLVCGSNTEGPPWSVDPG